MHIEGIQSAIAFGILYARLEDLISKNSYRRAYAQKWAKTAVTEFGSSSYCMIMLGLDPTFSRKRFSTLAVKEVREVMAQFKENE